MNPFNSLMDPFNDSLYWIPLMNPFDPRMRWWQRNTATEPQPEPNLKPEPKPKPEPWPQNAVVAAEHDNERLREELKRSEQRISMVV